MKLALIRSQPVQQSFCNGPAPSAIDTVIARTQLEVDDWYAAWATDFALLTDEYIAYVAKCAPLGGLGSMVHHGWRAASGEQPDCYYLDVSHGRV
jgi:hypothetical protein